jgi:choline transport protein
VINIESNVAFSNIASLGTCAMSSLYIISISYMFLKQWKNELLLSTHFSLGQAGIWNNDIAMASLCMAFFFAYFPTFPHPTPDLMN